MKKSVAKKIDWEKRDGWSKEEQVGYNQACNDWEVYHNHVIETEYTKNSKIVDFLEKHIHEMYVKKAELPTVEKMAKIIVEYFILKREFRWMKEERFGRKIILNSDDCFRLAQAIHARVHGEGETNET